jgi:hypothetical protein
MSGASANLRWKLQQCEATAAVLNRVVMQKNTINNKINLHEFADLSHNRPASFLLYCFGPCVLHGLFHFWRYDLWSMVFYAPRLIAFKNLSQSTI